MSSPILPAWATSLRARYLAGEASLFLVHGNVRDVHPWREADGPVEHVDLRTFLERLLGRTRDVVVYHNVSQGLLFRDREHERRFRASLDARRLLAGEPAMGALPRRLSEVLSAVEALVTDAGRRSAAILDFVEMLAPQADPAFLSEEDKGNLVTLQRWASDPALRATDNVVVFVTEHLASVARAVRASAQLAIVKVPYPDEADRHGFLTVHDAGAPTTLSRDRLAAITAGMSLIQLRGILQTARQSGSAIDFSTVAQRKKAVVEQECAGLVELVAPRHDLDDVGGMAEVKDVLRRVADAVKAGATSRVPMGMIFVGPMGTGKTFVAEAFAASSGLTCLKLANFRDRWVGSTEANLDKVLEVVEGLGHVLLIIDEADRALAGGESDGGTTSRVIARLKEFMSDTSHRGRVVMLMMTNRPDKLDADLKRPGRFDLKIPFFYPETPPERRLVLQAIARRARLDLSRDAELESVAHRTHGYSAAELESVLLAAAAFAAEQDDAAQIDADDLDRAVVDVIPSRDLSMLEYMEALAVFECSARRMLPPRYRDLSTPDVQTWLQRLRAELGRRAA